MMRVHEDGRTPISRSYIVLDSFFVLPEEEWEVERPKVHWCPNPRLVDGTEIQMIDQDGLMSPYKRTECGCQQDVFADILGGL